MNKIYGFFGIEFTRPLKWYDHILLAWVGFAFFALCIDLDSAPAWALFAVVANLAASLKTCQKVLPDIKEDESERM